MFKRTIDYVDLEGKTLTEEFYFHYSTAEATMMKVVFGDNIQEKIQALMAANDGKEIVQIFKGIIADSIGKKSPSGKSFVKTAEFRDEFMGSDAYSELLLWLLSDQNNMAQFVNGIFPANMQDRVGKLVTEREKAGKTTVELPHRLPEPNLTPAAEARLTAAIFPQTRGEAFAPADILTWTPEQFAEWKAKQI